MSAQPPAPPQTPPPAPAAGPPAGKKRGWGAVFSNTWVRVALIVLVIAAVVAVLLLGKGGSSSHGQKSLKGGGAAAGAPNVPEFEIKYPSPWSPASSNQMKAYPGKPLAVLIRKNRTGLIVISGGKSSRSVTPAKLKGTLEKKILANFPDAKTVVSKQLRVPAGKAYYFSFVRRDAGTVNAVLVVPAGGVTYQLNSVTPGNNPRAAKEIGRIILSFSLP